jgi:hypothetical protein
MAPANFTGFPKIQYSFGPKTEPCGTPKEKTELIIFAPKHQVKHFSDIRLKFDGTVLSEVSCVKNLGMYFDKTISMEQQASAITRSCFSEIRTGVIESYFLFRVIRRAAVFCTRCSLLMILLLVPYNNALPCILQTMSERKATERGVLTKPRLRSGTVYPCHCGMRLLWTFLKENLKLTFLELLLRMPCHAVLCTHI